MSLVIFFFTSANDVTTLRQLFAPFGIFVGDCFTLSYDHLQSAKISPPGDVQASKAAFFDLNFDLFLRYIATQKIIAAKSEKTSPTMESLMGYWKCKFKDVGATGEP